LKAYALVAYLPIFGWFFPMFSRQTNEFSSYHAKQGFGAAIFLVSFTFIVWFFSFLIPSFLLVLEITLFSVVGLVYFLMLLSGLINVLKGRKTPVAFFGKRFNKIKL